MTEFKVGDIVRTKSGEVIELESFNPNQNYAEDDETWAEGWSEYGTVSIDEPEDITLVMSAAEAASRKAPTATEIAASLDLLGDGWNGPVDVTETELDGDTVLCFGKTSDGLSVSFRVTVSNVFEGSY